VLACTDAFVYVDKPPGLHTVARWPGDLACLAAAVARAHPECGSASPDPREAGAIHRLDRETSGVVAFARSRAAWNDARDALRSGEVGRRYVAACPAPEDLLWPPALPRRALPAWLGPGPSASPPLPLPPLQPAPELSLRVRAPLGHGPDRGRVAVRLDGQPAATLVQPRGLCAAGLLCELELETGHRHQARVHLAWLGLPIRGDVRYGGIPAARLHLHAARLDLSRVLATEVAVEAPIDPAFLA
jgi:23S rRNA pseudouridine1911/1915/1917 synthase